MSLTSLAVKRQISDMTDYTLDALDDDRPRRGVPHDTMNRLIAAAAIEINEKGMAGATSTSIAARAGYATGTFYKHFPTKEKALIAAYEAWVEQEWHIIEQAVLTDLDPDIAVAQIIAHQVDLYTKWRGLRLAMRLLIESDEVALQAYRAVQLRQLEIAGALRAHRKEHRPGQREADAVRMMTLEAVFNSIADGEPEQLNLDRGRLIAHATAILRAAYLPVDGD